ncbi:hypothetical protein FEM44_13260 [Escherichia sp. E4742]|nr:hypothetical protein FEM44_13260 [Escherichia sp. E4742]TLJ09567.1 hypothetical protein FEK62_13260 [Escherichia sp. E4742]
MQLQVTQKGKAKKGYLWAYVSATGSERDIVVYDCLRGRGENMSGRCWPADRRLWWWTVMSVTARYSVTAKKLIPGAIGYP